MKRKINGSVKPFTKVESHFANTRSLRKMIPKKTMPSTMTSTDRGSTKNAIQVSKEDMPTHQLKKEESQHGGTSFSAKQTNIKVATTSGASPIVLRYISKSRRKDGQSSFTKCLAPKSTTKTDNRYGMVD